MRTSRALAIVLLLAAIGCGKKEEPPSPAALTLWKSFDGQRAFAHVERMVGFGARPSGSEALQKTQTYLVDELKKLGLRVEIQEFSDITPHGKIVFKNILAWLDRGNDIILLGSHYETKWFENITFVGANDAGSSTGALLELARVLSENRDALRSTVCFTFFDGEEAFVKFSETDGFYGSRYLVKQWKTSGMLARVKAMVLLDMVGDRDLTVTIPENSDAELTEMALKAAGELDVRAAHFNLMRGMLSDDLTAFSDEGVPALDIIDFQFGSRRPLNDYWHTANDTLDKLSPESLRICGQVTLRLLPMLDAAKLRRNKN